MFTILVLLHNFSFASLTSLIHSHWLANTFYALDKIIIIEFKCVCVCAHYASSQVCRHLPVAEHTQEKKIEFSRVGAKVRTSQRLTQIDCSD